MRGAYYGFSCLGFNEQFSEIVDYAAGKTERRLMMGTHMSSRSLRGLRVRDPKKTLSIDQIRGVYSEVNSLNDDENWFPVIHFNSNGPDTIDSELLQVDRLIHEPSDGREIIAPLRRLFRGFQLNAALPPHNYLRWFQANHMWSTRYEIILQLGELALSRANNDPLKLASIVAQYRDAVDYVLLDMSGGEGVPLDPEWARLYLRAIAQTCPWVRLGVAGKIGPNTLHFVEPLAGEFPDLSVDMETELRDGDNNFVVDKALRALDGLIKIFEG